MRQFDPIVKHILDLFGIEFAMLLSDEPGLEVLQRGARSRVVSTVNTGGNHARVSIL